MPAPDHTATSATEPALLRIDGPIATITLNRPAAFNAIDLSIAKKLEQHATAAADDQRAVGGRMQRTQPQRRGHGGARVVEGRPGQRQQNVEATGRERRPQSFQSLALAVGRGLRLRPGRERLRLP